MYMKHSPAVLSKQSKLTAENPGAGSPSGTRHTRARGWLCSVLGRSNYLDLDDTVSLALRYFFRYIETSSSRCVWTLRWPRDRQPLTALGHTSDSSDSQPQRKKYS